MSEKIKTFSNSISLTRVADGTSADSIIVEIPYEEILKFVIEEDGEEVLEFSPEKFYFRVYDVVNKTYITDFNWSLYYLNNNQEYEFIRSKDDGNGFSSAFGSFLKQEKIESIYLKPGDFYESLKDKTDFSYLKEKIDEGNAFFKFVYLENNNPIALAFFTIKNGISNEMAQMIIGANSINMAIRDSSLEFSSNGLVLENGDFAIYKKNAQDERENVFYMDGNNGDLVLKGTVYANSGQFHGDIYAENGYFNGSINANEGSIGGFQIVANSYEEIVKSNSANENAGLYYLLDENLGIYRYISVKDNKYYISFEYSSENNYYKKFTGSSFSTGTNYYEYNQTSKTYIKTSDTKPNSNKEYYIIYNFEYLDSVGGMKVDNPQEGNIYYVEIDLSNVTNLYKGLGAQLSSANNSIILNGTEGKIIAENIELGSGAKVTGKIEFANSDSNTASAVLYNPAINNNLFLETSQVKLYSDGKLNLGTIELYGGTGNKDGYIRSLQIDQNQQTQNGEWRINEDGTAYFNNIYANNVHIQNSILEIDTIQSVGSTMIFKDSWTITSLSKNGDVYTATLDGLANLSEDDYFISNNETFFKVKSFSNDTDTQKTTITFTLISNDDNGISKGSIITKFGRSYNESDYYSGYVISIRGEESLKGSSTFSSGNALTISSFIDNNSSIEYTKHLILGDLSDSGIDDLTDIYGYGLYADNVYLNGSLITRDINNGYCGINTLSSTPFIKKGALDSSPVILWGGASDKTIEAIQEAPFQVTANGTLFCKNAIIEQSVFTGEINTARIYGSSNENPSLTILDAKKGICFKGIQENYDESTGNITNIEVESFSIGSEGFHFDNQYFITINPGMTPLFSGVLNSTTSNYSTSYNGVGVNFDSKGFLKQKIDSGNYESSDTEGSLTRGTSQILVGFTQEKLEEDSNEENDKAVMIFEKTQIKSSVKSLFDKEINQGLKKDGTYFMQYVSVLDDESEIIGYDIYIN